MGSKDQIPLGIFESVGIRDGAPSNVFYFFFVFTVKFVSSSCDSSRTIFTNLKEWQ